MRPALLLVALALAGCATTATPEASAQEAEPSADLGALAADAARQFDAVRGVADTTREYGFGDVPSRETLYRAPLAADSAREALVTVTTDPDGVVTATYRATFGLSVSDLSFDQREERQRRRALNDATRDALLDTARAALPDWTLYDGISSRPVLNECEGFYGRSIEISTTSNGAHLEVRSGDQPCLPAPQQQLLIGATEGDAEAVARAIDAGAPLTIYGEGQYGSTALHIAAGSGHEEIVRLLLARGADPNFRSGEGLFPLNVATVETARLLLDAGAEPTPEPEFSNADPLGTAVVFDQLDKMRLLLDAGADPNVQSPVLDNQGPLHYAAVNGSPEAVRLLLASGASPDLSDALGYTPLLNAASGRGLEPETAIEMAQMLLAAGADVNRASNSQNSYAWTPLMEAARNGQTEIVRFLLSVDGVDLAARNSEGLTALGAARVGDHPDVVALLDTAGAPE